MRNIKNLEDLKNNWLEEQYEEELREESIQNVSNTQDKKPIVNKGEKDQIEIVDVYGNIQRFSSKRKFALYLGKALNYVSSLQSKKPDLTYQEIYDNINSIKITDVNGDTKHFSNKTEFSTYLGYSTSYVSSYLNSHPDASYQDIYEHVLNEGREPVVEIDIYDKEENKHLHFDKIGDFFAYTGIAKNFYYRRIEHKSAQEIYDEYMSRRILITDIDGNTKEFFSKTEFSKYLGKDSKYVTNKLARNQNLTYQNIYDYVMNNKSNKKEDIEELDPNASIIQNKKPTNYKRSNIKVEIVDVDGNTQRFNTQKDFSLYLGRSAAYVNNLKKEKSWLSYQDIYDSYRLDNEKIEIIDVNGETQQFFSKKDFSLYLGKAINYVSEVKSKHPEFSYQDIYDRLKKIKITDINGKVCYFDNNYEFSRYLGHSHSYVSNYLIRNPGSSYQDIYEHALNNKDRYWNGLPIQLDIYDRRKNENVHFDKISDFFAYSGMSTSFYYNRKDRMSIQEIYDEYESKRIIITDINGNELEFKEKKEMSKYLGKGPTYVTNVKNKRPEFNYQDIYDYAMNRKPNKKSGNKKEDIKEFTPFYSEPFVIDLHDGTMRKFKNLEDFARSKKIPSVSYYNNGLKSGLFTDYQGAYDYYTNYKAPKIAEHYPEKSDVQDNTKDSITLLDRIKNFFNGIFGKKVK